MRLGVALLLLLPVSAAGQVSRLERAEMVADVGDGSAPAGVEIEYRLLVAPDARAVPLRGLLAFGTRLSRVEAQVGEWKTPVTLRAATLPLVTGSIPLPRRVLADSILRLTLRYDVEGAVVHDGARFHVALPVLYVDWRPAAAPANTFVSLSRLPTEFLVGEGFPNVPRSRSVDRGAQVYRLALQVIPAFVSFRGRTDRGPFLPLGLALDLLILLILVGLGILTWIMMRRDHFWLPGDSAPDPAGPGRTPDV